MREAQHTETKLRGHSDTDWQTDAACRSVGPAEFYPEQGCSITANNAKRVCAGCLVATECLHFALDHHDRYGIWGGMGAKSRQRALRDEIAAGTYIAKLRPIRHGEPGGASEHYRRGEAPCWDCVEADKQRKARYKQDLRHAACYAVIATKVET